ncbi:MAG: M48 family metallopeptidase [Candidatus Aureabacteria bacterium]|nr:M48 family metallopeptidase [Candidatus Auribacterota bacterium]
MWELIRANKRKSIYLFILMFFVLAVLGFVIGGAVEPIEGPLIGLFISLAVFAVMAFTSYFAGDKVILTFAGARKVSHDMHPQLFNVVEEMKISANLPKMPEVYIIPSTVPNAFATGKNPENSAIAVTAGLLSKLNRDELQGVVAHEMSHILNRDILFMTLSGVMLGSIIFLSEVFLRSLMYGGRYSGGRRSRSKGGGQAVFLLIALVFSILGPIIAQLLYFAISRKREYLADASAVRLTRYPEGLASALEKISLSTHAVHGNNKTSKVLAPMYIINPLLEKKMNFSGLSSTHPPTSSRINILRNMAGGAGLLNYQRAYQKFSGERSSIIPISELRKQEIVGIRKPTVVQKSQKTQKKSIREAGDIIRAMSNFLFIVCVCGMKMKIPPDFKKKSIKCPRCLRDNTVPVAELAAVQAIGNEISSPIQNKKHKEVLNYRRKTKGWESFSCTCGNFVQLSPLFKGKHISCSKCSEKITIS